MNKGTHCLLKMPVADQLLSNGCDYRMRMPSSLSTQSCTNTAQLLSPQVHAGICQQAGVGA